MICDFHSHLLPGMDDGSDSVPESIRILEYLNECCVGQICATPHYSFRRESISHFLKRRRISAQALLSETDKTGMAEKLPSLMYGAEIKLHQGLSEMDGLSELCITGTNAMLLEMPAVNYDTWITEELYNVAFQCRSRVIVAHLNRYFPIYSESEINEILSVDNAVFQFNGEVLLDGKDTKRVKKIIESGYPCVFGYDIHHSADIKKSGAVLMDRFLESLSPEARKNLTDTEKTLLRK